MPPEPQEISGGRPRVSNRALLCAVIFILRHDVTWWALPTVLGCVYGFRFGPHRHVYSGRAIADLSERDVLSALEELVEVSETRTSNVREHAR